MNDIYKCCRWCRHFNSKSCGEVKTDNNFGWEIINLIEDGKLHEAIAECFPEDVTEEFIEKISSTVGGLLWDMKPDQAVDFEPKNPEEFYCRYFE